jgi:hypothetical protein
MEQSDQDGERSDTRAAHEDCRAQPATVDLLAAADRVPIPHRLHVPVRDEPGRRDRSGGDEYAYRDKPPFGPEEDHHCDDGTTDPSRDLDRKPSVWPISRVIRGHTGRTSARLAGMVHETLAAPAGVHRKGQGDHDATDHCDTCDPVDRPKSAHGSSIARPLLMVKTAPKYHVRVVEVDWGRRRRA